MSQSKAKFVILPNEIIYSIFDYLTVVEILQSFSHLQRRFDNLIQTFIKKIDLTNDWRGNRTDLELICQRIQVLKLDRCHIHLFYDYQFPELRSLHLVNVSKWSKFVSCVNLTLTTLSLWFDDANRSSSEQGRIPETIHRFSSNVVHHSDSFHSNLTHLTLSVHSMDDAVQIVRQSPSVEYLSINFVDHFNKTQNKSNLMINRVDRLKKLQKISFMTKNIKNDETNEYLPFNQIENFIDECCPDETILKRIRMNLCRITYSIELWSTINRYKETFHHFDSYISVMMDGVDLNNMALSFDVDKFGYHTEGNISSDHETRYAHLYSLPFNFDELYGFTSCSALDNRISYNSVRHLFFTETSLHDRSMCFESLSERMPYLTSIDCIATFLHKSNLMNPTLMIDERIFSHVRSLRFKSFCCDKYCICRNVLPQLIDRMPNLRNLTTSDDSFIRAYQQLSHITQLDLLEYGFKSFDVLIKRLPQLTVIALGDVKPYIRELSSIVAYLFIGLSALKLLSFQYYRGQRNDDTSYSRLIQQSLTSAQYRDKRLRYLRLDSESVNVVFYLEV